MDLNQEKCPICYESFNKFKKPYILLICGHTFCSYCINQIKKECLEDEEKYIKLDEYYKKQKKQTNLSDSQASLFSDNCKKRSSLSSQDSLPKGQTDIDMESKDSDSYDELDDNEDKGDNEDNEEIEDDEENDNKKEEKNNNDNNFGDEDDFDEEDNETDEDKNEEEEEESSEDDSNDNDDNSEKSFNNINDIIAINEANAKKEKKNKKLFKFKCPFCSVRIKISDKELIINENILKINEIVNNENLNNNNNDNTNNNKYFCESCNNVVDHYIHNAQFGTRHDNCLFELNNNMFKLASNNLKTFIQSKDEISSKLKIFLKNFNEYISKNDKLISDAKKNFLRYCKYNSKFMNVIKKSEKKLGKIEQTIKKKHENNPNLKLKEEIEYLESVKSFSQLIHGVFFFPQLKMKLNNTNEIAFEQSIKNSLKIYIDYSIKEIYNQFLENGFFHFFRNKLFKSESKYIPFYSTLTKRNFLFNSELNVLIKLKLPQKYSRSCYESSSDGSTIYGFGQSINSKTSEFFSINTHKKNITKLSPIPLVDFKQLDTILYNDIKLFVIGGLDKYSTPITSCFYFIIKKNIWHKMPKLKYNRYNKALYLNGKELIVFGGKCEAKDSSYIFEKIDLTELKSWDNFTIKNFSSDIYNFGYCAYNQDILFIVGGEDQVTEDYEKKGYAIDLKKKSVIEEFNINDVLENNIHTPKCYRGIILSTDKELYNIDFFNVWKRLHKLNINLP